MRLVVIDENHSGKLTHLLTQEGAIFTNMQSSHSLRLYLYKGGSYFVLSIPNFLDR